MSTRKPTRRAQSTGGPGRPPAAGLADPLRTGPLLVDIRSLFEAAREQTARAVNSALVGLYWRIGKRIHEDVLGRERAEYGEQVVAKLAGQLTTEYGQGFSRFNLFRMIKLAELFPDERIVATLSQQLSWSHFRELLPLEDPLQREFYAEMCRVERWSVRMLRHKIDHLLYERTAVAKKPQQLIAADLAALRDEDRMTPDLVFRDPYFLDFLGLKGQYAEHVELLQLDRTGIRVASYLAELPPQKVLEQKLHESLRLARERLANRQNAAAAHNPHTEQQTAPPKPGVMKTRLNSARLAPRPHCHLLRHDTRGSCSLLPAAGRRAGDEGVSARTHSQISISPRPSPTASPSKRRPK